MSMDRHHAPWGLCWYPDIGTNWECPSGVDLGLTHRTNYRAASKGDFAVCEVSHFNARTERLDRSTFIRGGALNTQCLVRAVAKRTKAAILGRATCWKATLYVSFREERLMKCFYGILAMALFFGWTPVLAQEKQETSAPGYGPCMGQGYGPGMMRGMTPEQRQQHWEQMRQQGYQPGMGRGYGPGMMRGITPEQRQQHWEQMRQQGYQPGMGRGMTPEQRQQHWQQMRQQGYQPGMGPGYGPGMMQRMPSSPPPENAEPQ